MTIEAASADSGRRTGNSLALMANKRFAGWGLVLSLAILLLLLATYVAAFDREGVSGLIDSIGVSIPLLLPFGFFFANWTRLFFGNKPIVIVEAGSVRFPTIGLWIDRADVVSLRDSAFPLAKGTTVVAELDSRDSRWLRTWLLFPAVFATPSRVYFSLGHFSGAIPGNRDGLLRLLRLSAGAGR